MTPAKLRKLNKLSQWNRMPDSSPNLRPKPTAKPEPMTTAKPQARSGRKYSKSTTTVIVKNGDKVTKLSEEQYKERRRQIARKRRLGLKLTKFEEAVLRQGRKLPAAPTRNMYAPIGFRGLQPGGRRKLG